MLLPSSGRRWRQHGPPKRRYPATTLYGVTIQKTSNCIIIVVCFEGRLPLPNLALRVFEPSSSSP